MSELLGVTAAVLTFVSAACLLGRTRKQEGLAWLESRPQDVARLYLRSASDVDAYWLHVEFRNGRKRMVAAPWEIDEALRRLAPLGLRLSAQDREALARLRHH
ncbi:hypothetical protein LLG90_14350 [Aromatoleum toluclasticum]|uniref:hypothetical protein n=1 Tax=Aromatoleum toluclasticum TaxID=92003 RepID=UPI001D181D29|nr:hypothetical protein [Aromatoleum toluclasticum]MCC4116540.1 hypothetical protein [Aromatoleum toluclasticum]